MNFEQSSQSRYRCKMDWGLTGVQLAVERQDIVVIVDTLRFSTAATSAIEHGAVIFPASGMAEAKQLAHRVGGVVASQRQASRFTLSPRSYEGVDVGTRIVLPSPNGAACTRYAVGAPHIFVAALVNAASAAAAVSSTLNRTEAGVTVIACGERRDASTGDEFLRFAVEDYLGAGAILSGLRYPKSPEARLCEAAFLHVENQIEQVMWDCVSGWELREKGLGDDVTSAAQVNACACVPVMHGEKLESLSGTSSAARN